MKLCLQVYPGVGSRVTQSSGNTPMRYLHKIVYDGMIQSDLLDRLVPHGFSVSMAVRDNSRVENVYAHVVVSVFCVANASEFDKGTTGPGG